VLSPRTSTTALYVVVLSLVLYAAVSVFEEYHEVYALSKQGFLTGLPLAPVSHVLGFALLLAVPFLTAMSAYAQAAAYATALWHVAWVSSAFYVALSIACLSIPVHLDASFIRRARQDSFLLGEGLAYVDTQVHGASAYAARLVSIAKHLEQRFQDRLPKPGRWRQRLLEFAINTSLGRLELADTINLERCRRACLTQERLMGYVKSGPSRTKVSIDVGCVRGRHVACVVKPVESYVGPPAQRYLEISDLERLSGAGPDSSALRHGFGSKEAEEFLANAMKEEAEVERAGGLT
jgi:hypothetical protein